ncbi:protein of unknown function [Burkholderia multivorans]
MRRPVRGLPTHREPNASACVQPARFAPLEVQAQAETPAARRLNRAPRASHFLPSA